MSPKSCFIGGQTPNPQIVNLFDSLHIEEGVLDNIMTDPFWGGFHEDSHCVSQNADGGGKNQNTECKCADWIDEGPFGFEVDDKSCSEDTWEKKLIKTLKNNCVST